MIAAIRTRLAAQTPALKLVGGAADFQTAAERNPAAAPAAFVFLVGEDPSANQLSNAVEQRIAATAAIVYCLSNASDASGAAAQADIDTLRAAGRAALYGWQPAANYDPLERGQSKLLAFRDGYIWWQDLYHSAYYDRSY